MNNTLKPKTGLWTLGAIFAPFIVLSAIAFLSYLLLPSQVSAFWSFVVLALSVGVGTYCLWRLPLAMTSRIWLTVAYVPTLTTLLVFYAFLIGAIITGDSL